MPGYNFKKAFYGKANKKASATVSRDFRRAVGQGYSMAKQRGGQAISQYLNGPGTGTLAGSSKPAYHYKTGSLTHSSAYSSRKTGYSQPGIMTRKNDHEIQITHSEYLGNLVSNATTNGFVSQNYPIQPGSATYPWVSGVAIQFQNYKFKKLAYEYRPMVSESTSNTSGALQSMGKVVLAVQYDSSLGPYTSSQLATNSEGSIDIKPSEHAFMQVECKSRLNPLGVYYVSGQGSLTVGANGSDIRMQNLGVLQVIADQVPTSGTAITLGEVWVHYTLVLEKPQLNAGLSNVLSSHYQITGSSSTYALGTSQTSVTGNYLPLTFINPTTCNSFYFPLQITEGSFLIVWTMNGTLAASSAGPIIVATQACTLVSAWYGSTTTSVQVPSVGTVEPATRTAAFAIVTINAPGSLLAQITFTPEVGPTSNTCDLVVTPYNTGMA